MSASYPPLAKSFTVKTDGSGKTIFAAHVNDLQDEVVAIENALLSGVAHALKPSSASAQDLGTASLPWAKARIGGLQLTDATTLTLATDAATVTQSYHALDTESAAATDNCATLTAWSGVAAGFIVHLRAADVTHIVTLQDGVGNLLLNGSCALSTTDATISLIYDGTNWRELARSNVGTAVTLLKAGNGSDTSAGATVVDSIAITGLTANDRIKVFYSLTGAVANTAQVVLYSVTDSLTLVALSPSPLAFGDPSAVAGEAQIGQRQGSATQAFGLNQGMLGGGTRNDFFLFTTPATAWTGSWTLGLRHGGVTATGSLKWSWAVYKFAGQ